MEHPSISANQSILKSAWVEIGPGAQALARAVKVGDCPQVDIDGIAVSMNLRAGVSEAFPISICELALPEKYRHASVGGVALPVWSKNVQRILFLGDTGCRIKKQKNGTMKVQACNDPEKWPFSTIAVSAAAWKPDLVIHVGDYHYREADCPVGNSGCAGSITGDRWGSWEQDFFGPASPLLRAAPWVFVRGNHELCKSAGKGWFSLLDPRAVPSECTDTTPVYEVPIAGHRLEVLDSADELNIGRGLSQMKPSLPGDLLWLLLHRPFLTPGADDEAKKETHLPPALARPGALSVVFTGHRHILSFNQFEDSRPPEMITGNGGDWLEDPSDKSFGSKGVSKKTYLDFGFLTLEKTSVPGQWNMEAHDRNGAVIKHCALLEQAGKRTSFFCQE